MSGSGQRASGKVTFRTFPAGPWVVNLGLSWQAAVVANNLPRRLQTFWRPTLSTLLQGLPNETQAKGPLSIYLREVSLMVQGPSVQRLVDRDELWATSSTV